MKSTFNSINFIGLSFIAVLFIVSTLVLAHPEDEFCQDAVMDPVLCEQLAELDRVANKNMNNQLPKIDLKRSFFETITLYTEQGIKHIIPMGVDHLAFVLALILCVTSFKNLAIQISLFTVAHSVTLILSMLGILNLTGVWVEVAIAFSIAFVAFENLFFKSLVRWRMLVVFCFGLLHGLGFAGALNELGIPNGHFISALVGFNIGVEIAQLCFALVIYLLLNRLSHKEWYRSYVTVPLSLMVGVLGCYWVIERLF